MKLRSLNLLTKSITSRRCEIHTEKVDEAVLALLNWTLHDGARAWKSFDWESLNQLHAKSEATVALTDEGLRASQREFGKLFAKR